MNWDFEPNDTRTTAWSLGSLSGSGTYVLDGSVNGFAPTGYYQNEGVYDPRDGYKIVLTTTTALQIAPSGAAIYVTDANGINLSLGQPVNASLQAGTYYLVVYDSRTSQSVSSSGVISNPYANYSIQLNYQASNPPQAGSVSIGDAYITEGNNGTQLLNFTVTRVNGTAAFSINYATSDNSASTADSDYVAKAGTLNFAQNDNEETISIVINGDLKVEPDEIFAINLSGGTNGVSIADGSAIGTIRNDDVPIVHTWTLTALNATVIEGGVATFRIHRSGAENQETVYFSTTMTGGAKNNPADPDYAGKKNLAITLLPGQYDYDVQVQSYLDNRNEGSETFGAIIQSAAAIDSNPDALTPTLASPVAWTIANVFRLFGAPSLATNAFGASASAGGWSSNGVFPRQVADVNGDGRDDIVGFGGAGVYVSLANTDATFQPVTGLAVNSFGSDPAAGGWSSNNAYPRHVADVNGDGRADIVGFGGAGVYVALANADGTFQPVTALAVNSFGSDPAAGGWSNNNLYYRDMADVNGDGRADIVGFGGNGVFVSLANDNGTFQSAILAINSFGAAAAGGGWTNDDAYPRRLGDVNDDGRADIVGFGATNVYIALGQADGTFGPVLSDVASFGPNAGGWSSNNAYPREVADVNGDGAADIVGFGGAGVYVATNGFLLS